MESLAIDTEKIELVNKINVAAYSELTIKVLNASAENTEHINRGLAELLKYRTQIASAYIVCFDAEKENLLELFKKVNEEIKRIIGI
jgi:hypothetical protein